MMKTIEKLWHEYFAEECAWIDTEEERTLAKKAAQMREKAVERLSKEQCDVMEQYVEILYEMQAFLSKKAFCKGCEFALSFLLEAGSFKKA